MKNYAVIQHNYSEFLGQIEGQLEKRDIGFSYIRPFVGQAASVSAWQYDALFLLGASYPLTDSDNMPWVEEEKSMVEAFKNAGRPVVGIGHGGMLLAAMSGAEISGEPLHNAYWTTAHLTAAGENDALAKAVDGRRVLVMAHGRATLPEDVQPILVDDDGRWIAIRPESNVYGMLFRPELKPGMIEDMIMEAKRSTPDNVGELLETARAEWDESQRTTDAVIVALVKELDLMKERHKPPVFRLSVED